MFKFLRAGWARLLARRHGGLVIVLLGFFVVSTVTRLALTVRSAWLVSWDASLVAAMAWGVVFDLAGGLLATIPLLLVLTALPAGFFRRRFGRGVGHALLVSALFLLLFGAVAEWMFWDEFSARFNFIAVDYLVYTTEVLANLRESYPLSLIFAGLGLITLALYAWGLRLGWVEQWLDAAGEGWRRRYRAAAGWMVAMIVVGVALDSGQLSEFANNYNRELAKNGLWSLFAAFRNNELEYDQFYPTLPVDTAFQTMRAELARHERTSPLRSNGTIAAPDRDTLRWVAAPRPGPELRPNVIQITVESLSADFVSAFNRASRLTPNLGALAEKSLMFENLYATGTRTDRGMEALTLALPPTPGRSLIKRPRNADLFTLGSVFRSRGYDTAFIYGGYGYFDNMNAFFGGNGYRVIDRAAVAKSDITFANAWGACDEDVFRWTLREADAAHAAGKPFHYFVMTTSNHRPYTYPDGKIDLPSKISGRAGAVKYTDYAVGQLLAQAATHPWFKNTIFVIVADHCAAVAGRAELPVQNYHIPMFIYAPGGQIAPGRVKDLMSQVDYAPTLLGLLNWSYASRFFGWDVINGSGGRRALIGNYQRLGLYEPGELQILKPVNGRASYRYDPSTHQLTAEKANAEREALTIAYYQTASSLYRRGAYQALSVKEQMQLKEAASRVAGDDVTQIEAPRSDPSAPNARNRLPTVEQTP